MGVDPAAKKMSEASEDVGIAPPKTGETFRCSECGMEIRVTADCHCKEGERVHLACCGKQLTKV